MLEDAEAFDEEWAHWPVAPLRSFSPGLQPRMRALLVIPIVMAILLTIFVVMSFCISECPGGEREGGREGGLSPAEPASV